MKTARLLVIFSRVNPIIPMVCHWYYCASSRFTPSSTPEGCFLFGFNADLLLLFAHFSSLKNGWLLHWFLLLFLIPLKLLIYLLLRFDAVVQFSPCLLPTYKTDNPRQHPSCFVINRIKTNFFRTEERTDTRRCLPYVPRTDDSKVGVQKTGASQQTAPLGARTSLITPQTASKPSAPDRQATMMDEDIFYRQSM